MGRVDRRGKGAERFPYSRGNRFGVGDGSPSATAPLSHPRGRYPVVRRGVKTGREEAFGGKAQPRPLEKTLSGTVSGIFG